MFEDGIDTNTARNCVNGLVEKYSGFSAFFTGNDEAGYSFIIGSKNADCNTVLIRPPSPISLPILIPSMI